MQTCGPIVRHATLQGETPDAESKRTRQRREDQACTAGLRNPAGVLHKLPHIVPATRSLVTWLRRARARDPTLQRLSRAGGPSPDRPPPTEEAVAAVRRDVAGGLGILPAEAERSHPAAPWKHELFRALGALVRDPDEEVAEWLTHGAPMGLEVPIRGGGHLPTLSGDAEITPGMLEPLDGEDVNHESFRGLFEGDSEAAGLALVRQAVEAGFGELFADSSAAEAALRGIIYPAPLGTVSKVKPDGSWKHRLIQDLKANRVNAAVSLPERLVLPRAIELASDLAALGSAREPGDVIMTGIIDFKDAFMSIPLASVERRFNCAALPSELRRTRPPLHATEPVAGRVVVWRVLGFGGRPNPLVFGRVTSVLMRIGQAVLTSRQEWATRSRDPGGKNHDYIDASARCHLYVDDAAAAFRGSREDIEEAFDLLILLWLVMGAPISWPKVGLQLVDESRPTRWIGVDFSLVAAGARMRLPPEFIAELLAQVLSITSQGGRVTDADANRLVGRAARVAFVVPAAGPFAAAVRAALEDARATAATSRSASQRRSHAGVRFEVAAAWFAALLREQTVAGGITLPLERLVLPGGPRTLTPGACDAVVFDASPWGGGAILYRGKVAMELMVVSWTPELCEQLGVIRGDSAFLSYLEALTALAALVRWCVPGGRRCLALVGDNVAALTVAVSQRGRGDLGRICREVALRQSKLGLEVAVGHLASKLNSLADALSRLTAPSPAEWPEELQGVLRRDWPSQQELFLIGAR